MVLIDSINTYNSGTEFLCFYAVLIFDLSLSRFNFQINLLQLHDHATLVVIVVVVVVVVVVVIVVVVPVVFFVVVSFESIKNDRSSLFSFFERFHFWETADDELTSVLFLLLLLLLLLLMLMLLLPLMLSQITFFTLSHSTYVVAAYLPEPNS